MRFEVILTEWNTPFKCFKNVDRLSERSTELFIQIVHVVQKTQSAIWDLLMQWKAIETRNVEKTFYTSWTKFFTHRKQWKSNEMNVLLVIRFLFLTYHCWLRNMKGRKDTIWWNEALQVIWRIPYLVSVNNTWMFRLACSLCSSVYNSRKDNIKFSFGWFKY